MDLSEGKLFDSSSKGEKDPNGNIKQQQTLYPVHVAGFNWSTKEVGYLFFSGCLASSEQNIYFVSTLCDVLTLVDSLKGRDLVGIYSMSYKNIFLHSKDPHIRIPHPSPVCVRPQSTPDHFVLFSAKLFRKNECIFY